MTATAATAVRPSEQAAPAADLRAWLKARREELRTRYFKRPHQNLLRPSGLQLQRKSEVDGN